MDDSAGDTRTRRYTPAVTRVDEWTRAETGVGAAMAAGSQAANGIWALLVVAAKVISVINNSWEWGKMIIVRSPLAMHNIIAIISKASPSRLVRTVSMAALKDLGFW